MAKGKTARRWDFCKLQIKLCSEINEICLRNFVYCIPSIKTADSSTTSKWKISDFDSCVFTQFSKNVQHLINMFLLEILTLEK
jgi:hypothetical protein